MTKNTDQLFQRYYRIERNFMEVLLTGQDVSEREELLLELMLNDLLEAHKGFCEARIKDQITKGA